jgi:integrase
MQVMASIRERVKADGTKTWAVLYRLDGKQTSTSFVDFASAQSFCQMANKFGVENALSAWAADVTTTGWTVESWLRHHVEHLTGVDPNTLAKYRAYIANDIAEPLGGVPLTALSRDHVAVWIQGLQEPDSKGKVSSAKTVTNKHGFLAGALNAAVSAGHIPANPCSGMRMPRDDDPRQMVTLSRDEFAHLLANVSEYWRPMVRFLAASGARWGEVAALRPGDVDRQACTVTIRQSWKQGVDGYRLGSTKTVRSQRTINVPKSVLDTLDYSNDYLFINRAGGPVRAQGFHSRVWSPALQRAWPPVDADGNEIKDPLRPRVHDLRHSTASWMILAGIPLPVVQQHLGHESITTTVNTYGHLDRRSMEKAADAIEAVLRDDDGGQTGV